MQGKSLSTIAEELNNILTVVAMCTDELESGVAKTEAVADLRDAIRRGATLARLVHDHALIAPPASDRGAISDVREKAPPTVLVVEPDASLRTNVARAITLRGRRVVEATTISEAATNLERVREVDLIVLDTGAPSRRFASQLVERYPGISVVYTGAFIDDEPLRRELPTVDVSLLCRPFSTNLLVDRIDQVFARRS